MGRAQRGTGKVATDSTFFHQPNLAFLWGRSVLDLQPAPYGPGGPIRRDHRVGWAMAHRTYEGCHPAVRDDTELEQVRNRDALSGDHKNKGPPTPLVR